MLLAALPAAAQEVRGSTGCSARSRSCSASSTSSAARSRTACRRRPSARPRRPRRWSPATSGSSLRSPASNRALLVSEDGEQTKFFFVDNDNSSSRLRFEGTGEISDDLSVGAVLEAELQSNSTRAVSQDNESTGSASFEDRKVEVYFDSARLGRIWLGQGSTAADGASEADLSGTDVVGTSDLPDYAGGLQFVDDGELSGVTIGDSFDHFDGARDDRIATTRRNSAASSWRPRRSPTASSTSPATTPARSTPPSSRALPPSRATPATSSRSTARRRCCWPAASTSRLPPAGATSTTATATTAGSSTASSAISFTRFRSARPHSR